MKEIYSYIPRVKNRVQAPRYRIYKVRKNKFKMIKTLGPWRLAFQGFIECCCISWDDANKEFQRRIKEVKCHSSMSQT